MSSIASVKQSRHTSIVVMPSLRMTSLNAGGFSQGRPCSVEPQQVEFSFCNVLPRQRSSRQPAPLSTLQAEFNSTVLMFRHQERN